MEVIILTPPALQVVLINSAEGLIVVFSELRVKPVAVSYTHLDVYKRQVGGDGVIDIANRPHLGKQADFTILEAPGVTRAVGFFMVVQNHIESDLNGTGVADQQFVAFFRVFFDDVEFFVGQLARFVEYLSLIHI